MNVLCDLDHMDMMALAVLDKSGKFPVRVALTVIEGDTEARIVLTDPSKLIKAANWLLSAAEVIRDQSIDSGSGNAE